VYVCTDPVIHEVLFAPRETKLSATLVEEHDDVVTFGMNIGGPDCSLPPLPQSQGEDLPARRAWSVADRSPTKPDFTTVVGNWRQDGRDSVFEGSPITGASIAST